MWDPEKRRTNLRKHGVDFVDAVGALEDEHALTKTAIEGGEYRFKTLGMGAKPKVLLVVHAEEDEGSIAIISARAADGRERRQYYEELIDE